MATNPSADQMVGVLRETVVSLVRRDGPDLSARQLGVFLTCYLRDGGHTVRGLAADLNVSKPAITRALDRLGELDLARRKVDPLDRRSVLVQRTLKGAAFLRDLRSIMGEAAILAKRAPANSRDIAAPGHDKRLISGDRRIWSGASETASDYDPPAVAISRGRPPRLPFSREAVALTGVRVRPPEAPSRAAIQRLEPSTPSKRAGT